MLFFTIGSFRRCDRSSGSGINVSMTRKNSLKIVAVILVCTTSFASATAEELPANTNIAFESQISATGNLFYQVECLAQRIRCSAAAFRQLWDRIGPLDASDASALQEFSDVLNTYTVRANLGPRPGGQRAATSRFGNEVVDIGPPPTSSYSLHHRIRQAAYGSESMTHFAERMRLFMHPDDADTINAVIARFWPRFNRWWVEEGVVPLTSFEAELSESLEEQNRTTLPSVAAFFGLDTATQPLILSVHLIAHPLESSPTRAEVIGNQAVVEVLAGEQPAGRIAVIVHELVHYLFAIAPPAIHEVRLQGALQAQNSRSSAALGIMNEALATAIGNGYVEEQLQGEQFAGYFERDRSFYAQPDIDTAAKSIYPLIREYLDDGRLMDEEFIDQYYANVAAAVGGDLDSVRSRLRVSAYVATDDELASAMRQVPQVLGINSLYGSTLAAGDANGDSVLHRHDYLNGVVLLRESDRQRAGQLLVEAQHGVGEIESGTVSSCVFERPSRSSIYFVVLGPSLVGSDEIVDLLEKAEACR